MRVCVAMSGGVDSAVAAYELMRQGYDCEGATMILRDDSSMEADIADARACADLLGIPHHVLDFRKEFESSVVSPFCSAYLDGFTPNPCVSCNRQVKIPLLVNWASERKMDFVATGHYARIERDEAGKPCLLRGDDRSKDQSYMLAQVSLGDLEHLLLPMGQISKVYARQIAAEIKLPSSDRPESQDICFISDGNYISFIEHKLNVSLEPGDILDPNGKVVGRHLGCARYTIGQRKGIGVAMGYPAYVIAKDARANTVTVGPRELLQSSGLLANNWNWLADPATLMDFSNRQISVTVKISYRQNPIKAKLEVLDGSVDELKKPQQNQSQIRITYAEPAIAAAPGQTVVAYLEDMVLGGGTIVSAVF